MGIKRPSLGVGQPMKPMPEFYWSTGDGSMELIANESIRVWEAMPCYRFTMTANPGVNHSFLPSDPGVVQRLLENLQRPRSVCR